MDAHAVHVDGRAQTQGETGEFLAHMEFFVCGLHGDGQGRGAGPGHKSGQNRFPQFPEDRVGIFPADEGDEQRVADKDHQQDPADHAPCHLKIGLEQGNAEFCKAERGQREHADREIFQDPVHDLKIVFWNASKRSSMPLTC